MDETIVLFTRKAITDKRRNDKIKEASDKSKETIEEVYWGDMGI